MIDISKIKKSYYKYVDLQNNHIGIVDNKFYSSMADAVFEATLRALDPTFTDMVVVPAQTGSGKSTYTEAMAAALYENDLTCSIVAKTINQCYAIYKNIGRLVGQPTGKALDDFWKYDFLDKSLPKIVVIYTSVHKEESSFQGTNLKFDLIGMEKFGKEERCFPPIMVSTHRSLLNEIESGFDLNIQEHFRQSRSVIFLDEKPDFNVTGIISKSDIQTLIDKLHPNKYKKHYDALEKLRKKFQSAIQTVSNKNVQYTKDINLFDKELDNLFANKDQGYFDQGTIIEYFDIKGVKNVFSNFSNFLKALKSGFNFYSVNDGTITYSFNLFENNPAFVLLDATAEIEEFQKLHGIDVKSVISTPNVTYKNLSINHITPPNSFTGNNTSSKSFKYINEYMKYILNKVCELTDENDKIFIVIKKSVADSIYQKNLINPYRPFKHKNREIHIIYWGSFIGENEWSTISNVFLFNEFIKPKSIYIGLDASYKDVLTDGMLKEQSGSNLKGDVLKLKENDSLKWFKQLAARGNIRNIDSKGVAGKMELFTDADFFWLIKNQKRAFPGSPKIKFIKSDINPKENGKRKIINFLAHHQIGICTYSDLAIAGDYTNSHKINKLLKIPQIANTIDYLGWVIVNKSEVPQFEGNGRKRLVNWKLYKN